MGGGIARMDSFLKAAMSRDVDGVPADTLKRIATTYGTGYDRILQIARDMPELRAPLGDHCPVIGAEILYAARHEMAPKLADVLLRRTEAGAAGHPGADAIERAAAIIGAEHGWDASRIASEIGDVQSFFALPRE